MDKAGKVYQRIWPKDHSLRPLSGWWLFIGSKQWGQVAAGLFKPVLATGGGSLVEVIVMLAVISVLVGGVVPLGEVVSRFQVDYEAGRLVQRLNYARDRSKQMDYFSEAEGRPYIGLPRLYLDGARHQYGLRQGNRLIVKWQYAANVTITCNRGEMVFSPSGEVSNGTYTISAGKKIRRVIVDRVGRIRVE